MTSELSETKHGVILVIMKDKKPKRKTTSDDYRYEIVHTEEMSQQDIDSLAMSIASFIYDELRKVAIDAMKCFLPDFNPLNDPDFNKGEAVQVDEATRNRYPYEVRCNINLKNIPGIENSDGFYLLYRAPQRFDEPDENTGESE